MAGQSWDVSTVGFDLLWMRCGLDEFPLVLQLTSHGRTLAERDELMLAELPVLQQAGAMRGSTVHPDLEAALHITKRPEEEIDVRGRAGRRRWRVLGAADRGRGVLLVREEDRVRITLLPAADVAAQVVATLPQAAPGSPAQLNAPTDELTALMSGVRQARDAVGGLQRLGCSPADAQVLGEALTTLTGSSTVGLARRAHGHRERHPQVVTVLETPRGRYLSTVSPTRGGGAYTTVRPATPAAVLQAVQALRGVELAGSSYLRST